MIRTFLAIEVSDDVRTEILQVQHDLKQQLAGSLTKDIRIAWGQPNSFHLTIRFLGDTDKQLLDPMREALAIVRRSHPTIQIPLDRLQAFPNLQKPRVLWVGPSEQWRKGDAARQLTALHREIEACCHSFGFAPDDKLFNPHLTLARIKAGEREMGQWLAQSGVCDQPFSLGEVRIGPLVLVKSHLRPTGPVYTKLWEVE